jgi:DNA-binding MarR family transcriptional regulator
MHHLLFALKRGYHRGLAKAVPFARRFELTPARYDVMFVLFTEGMPAQMRVIPPQTTQMDLRRALGVSRETVRRLLVALEQRGYIIRSRIPRGEGDRRTRMVVLTDLGRSLVRRATKLLYPLGLLRDPVQPRPEPLHAAYVTASSEDVVEPLFGYASLFARQLGDRSAVDYPDFVFDH